VDADADELAHTTFKANYKTLGRRFGKQMRDAAAAISELTSEQWRTLRDGGEVEILGQPIHAADIDVRTEAKGDVVIETQGALTVALDTELDDSLRREGVARELVSRIQRHRKDAGFEVIDRIQVTIDTQDASLTDAVQGFSAWIAGEVLAASLTLGTVQDGETLDIDGRDCRVHIVRV
jgi:isoleucyl-tRNA synthetase